MSDIFDKYNRIALEPYFSKYLPNLGDIVMSNSGETEWVVIEKVIDFKEEMYWVIQEYKSHPRYYHHRKIRLDEDRYRNNWKKVGRLVEC